MKLNLYVVLLTTGVLMVVTVLLAQTGSSVSLLKEGVQSVDKDISSYAAMVLSSSDRQRVVASGTDQATGALDNLHVRVASTEKMAPIDGRSAEHR